MGEMRILLLTDFFQMTFLKCSGPAKGWLALDAFDANFNNKIADAPYALSPTG